MCVTLNSDSKCVQIKIHCRGANKRALGITEIFFVFAACRPGFYKAFAGNTKCSKCPPHSLTYMEATSVCQCEKGYFRAEKDPPSMACTSKSICLHLKILFRPV